jgi:hypothetical protein
LSKALTGSQPVSPKKKPPASAEPRDGQLKQGFCDPADYYTRNLACKQKRRKNLKFFGLFQGNHDADEFAGR